MSLNRNEIEMIRAWERDKRYSSFSSSLLREIRNRIFSSLNTTKYEKSLIQYWLMKRENRLDSLLRNA